MKNDQVRPIAFYLPQFYINDINDRLWGEGFTEWTNVAQGRPNFEGHYQPHIPGKLGFYDLSHESSIEKQVELAKSFGIYGFCFYYYWFDGKRALDVPLNLFLNSKLDFPFCLCWANENWSKKWDGGDNEVILRQSYKENFEQNFIASIRNILVDSRYIRLGSKPVLLFYRPGLFRDPKKSITLMREQAIRQGIGDLHILVIDFYVDEKNIKEWGADGIVEFPPHRFFDKELAVSNIPGKLLNQKFTGHILDYRKIILRSLNKWNDDASIQRIRGIIPGWDNTARRKNSSMTVFYNSPFLYQEWLTYLILYSRQNNSPFIFINAWNEWAEGCHLEPDRLNGFSYLEATKLAFQHASNDLSLYDVRKNLKKELQKSITKQNRQDLIESDYYEQEVISVKDFIKSRLFKHPFLYEKARKLYLYFLRFKN